MKKLDLIDKKLLQELDINARSPISQLAKKLKISRDVTNYRMKKLEKDQIIRGYRTYINSAKLGYKMYRCYFKFYAITKEEYKNLINLLVENKNIFWVGETDGFVDVVFGVLFENSISFNKFYRNIIEKFRKVIKQDYVHEVISYSYLDRQYLLKKENTRQELIIGNSEKEKYDSTDWEILKILSQHARSPIIEIASKLKMDSASIIYRIKQLEKRKIIIGYKVDLNLALINRHFYTIKMYLSDFEKKEELITYLKAQSFVTNFTEAIGSWDVEVDVEVESDEEYHKFINDIKEKYDFISEIAFFRAPKTFKIINMPA
jgi:Lrp/AsnC family leucine-responsive transcriptional regulator